MSNIERCSAILIFIFCFKPATATQVADARSTTRQAVPVTDSCTPEKPLATEGETIEIRLWTATIIPATQVNWTATAGRIDAKGKVAVWDLTGAPAGYQSASAHYANASGPATCSVRVVVMEETGGRGVRRETGHDLLVSNTNEAAGYGLYSYVLLGSAPDENSRDRCLKLMEAFLNQAPLIADLEKYFDKKQLNLTYIPVVTAPQTPPSAQWLLDHYDYARARFFLHSLPGNASRGPYIVSSLHPLGSVQPRPGPFLSQDLSSVPPHLAALWTSEFLNQAAQEHFWEQDSGKMLELRLRTAIGILAEGLPDVQKGLKEWISSSR